MVFSVRLNFNSNCWMAEMFSFLHTTAVMLQRCTLECMMVTLWWRRSSIVCYVWTKTMIKDQWTACKWWSRKMRNTIHTSSQFATEVHAHSWHPVMDRLHCHRFWAVGRQRSVIPALNCTPNPVKTYMQGSLVLSCSSLALSAGGGYHRMQLEMLNRSQEQTGSHCLLHQFHIQTRRISLPPHMAGTTAIWLAF